MSVYDIASGAVSGTARPAQWAAGTMSIDDIKDWAENGASVMPALFLDFEDDHYLRGADYAPHLNLLGSCSRNSKAWDPNWSFRSGDAVGWLIEYQNDEYRFGDYGPLKEGAGTNHIRNPLGEGATPGTLSTTGVLPSNWTVSGIADSAVELVGVTSSRGWRRVRLKFNGTPTADIVIGFEAADQTLAANGQDWTLSGGAALAAGDLTNLSDLRFRVTERDAAGVELANDQSGALGLDGTHRRFYHTHTLAGGGSVARATGEYVLPWTSGAVSFTLDIFIPQLENSDTASSPILPPTGTPGVSVREADSITGVTTDRDSRAFYDDRWDGTNGGLTGTLREVLPGVPCIGDAGLLPQPTRTNEIRNPRCLGALLGQIGSGGAMPTHWLASLPAEVTATVHGYGTRNGYPCIDIELTATGTAVPQFYFEQSQIITATNGDDVTLSFGASVISSSGTVAVRPRCRENNGASFVRNTDGSDLGIDAFDRRFTYSVNISDANVSNVQPGILISFTGAGSIRLCILAPQLEKAATASRVILPEPNTIAASTRARDEIVVDLPDGFQEGTLVVEYFSREGAFSIGVLSDGSFNERVSIESRADIDASIVRVTTGSTAHIADFLTQPDGVVRTAVAFGTSGADTATTGNAPKNHVFTANYSQIDRLYIGAQPGFGFTADTLIKSIRVFTVRLPANEIADQVA